MNINVTYLKDTFGLSQKDIAALFNCSIDNIYLHVKNIFKSGELDSSSIIEEFSVTEEDGKIITLIEPKRLCNTRKMKKEKAITRKILRNGDIICIPIEGKGFAYAKYINVDVTFGITHSYSEYVKFYIGIYPERISDISQLNREVLIPPVSIVTYTVVRRLGWEIFYNESVFEEDKIISDTRQGWPPFVYYSDESLYDGWRFWHFSPNEMNKIGSKDVPYENIKHLPLEGILSAELIPTWLIIENNKFLKRELEDGFDTIGEKELFILDREPNRPCYALLDKETRDRAFSE